MKSMSKIVALSMLLVVGGNVVAANKKPVVRPGKIVAKVVVKPAVAKKLR